LIELTLTRGSSRLVSVPKVSTVPAGPYELIPNPPYSNPCCGMTR